MKITRIRFEPHDHSFWESSGLTRRKLRWMLKIHKRRKHPNPPFDFRDHTLTSVFRLGDRCVFIETYSSKLDELAGRTMIRLKKYRAHVCYCTQENAVCEELFSLAYSKNIQDWFDFASCSR